VASLPGLSAYEVAVENGFRGTKADWLKSLKGKAGDSIKGDKGDDGLSAYQVAVANGFVGSESVWLASLKGEPGKKGDPGKDGNPGKDGTPAPKPAGYRFQVIRDQSGLIAQVIATPMGI
jgi:hypothetical protein